MKLAGGVFAALPRKVYSSSSIARDSGSKVCHVVIACEDLWPGFQRNKLHHTDVAS